MPKFRAVAKPTSDGDTLVGFADDTSMMPKYKNKPIKLSAYDMAATLLATSFLIGSIWLFMWLIAKGLN